MFLSSLCHHSLHACLFLQWLTSTCSCTKSSLFSFQRDKSITCVYFIITFHCCLLMIKFQLFLCVKWLRRCSCFAFDNHSHGDINTRFFNTKNRNGSYWTEYNLFFETLLFLRIIDWVRSDDPAIYLFFSSPHKSGFNPASFIDIESKLGKVAAESPVRDSCLKSIFTTLS